jgi:hypothetical protein
VGKTGFKILAFQAHNVHRYAADVKALRADLFAREGRLGRVEAELAAARRYGRQLHSRGFMVYGLWFMVYGLWFMVYGLWFMVYGLWFMVYGLWFMV